MINWLNVFDYTIVGFIAIAIWEFTGYVLNRGHHPGLSKELKAYDKLNTPDPEIR